MSYTKEQLEHLWDAYCEVRQRRQQLLERYVIKQFKSDKSREYAQQGFSRRLRMLMHCIDGVFTRLPPNTQEPPKPDDLLDGTVYLQAFVFNAFGCIDNLAHIWVNEKGVTDQKGNPLPNKRVGFRKDNHIVLRSLSPPFREYLISLEPWLGHLENMRHALAHRIPLYIPPYFVPDDNLTEYHAIGAASDQASRRRDYDEVEKLEGKQRALTTFQPVATHSFEEGAPVELIHPQMIADYNTVEEIAQKLLEELDA